LLRFCIGLTRHARYTRVHCVGLTRHTRVHCDAMQEPDESTVAVDIRELASTAPAGVAGLIGVGTQLTFNYGGTHAASIRAMLAKVKVSCAAALPPVRAFSPWP
jgi:hypothetical protein